MDVKRLLVGSLLGGALLAGVAAPLATAGPVPEEAVPNQGCFASTGDYPLPGPDPGVELGEGFLFVYGSDESADGSCSYTSTGEPLTWQISGLSGWELTVTRGVEVIVLSTSGDVASADTNRVTEANGSFAPEPGDVITVTAKKGCDPSGAQCGTMLVAKVGGNPQPPS